MGMLTYKYVIVFVLRRIFAQTYTVIPAHVAGLYPARAHTLLRYAIRERGCSRAFFGLSTRTDILPSIVYNELVFELIAAAAHQSRNWCAPALTSPSAQTHASRRFSHGSTDCGGQITYKGN